VHILEEEAELLVSSVKEMGTRPLQEQAKKRDCGKRMLGEGT